MTHELTAQENLALAYEHLEHATTHLRTAAASAARKHSDGEGNPIDAPIEH